MVKHGILHDYDLAANREPTAQGNVCIICGADPVLYQWSDYSGEGMCAQCGTPYQLKWGSDEQQEENNYPYLNVKDEWVPIVREHWEITEEFVCLGSMLNGNPGYDEFIEWVKENHPKVLEDAE